MKPKQQEHIGLIYLEEAILDILFHGDATP